MTNGDRIRAMCDEELAVWIFKPVQHTDCAVCPAHDFCIEDDAQCDCPTTIYHWLLSQEKAEVEEDGGDR